ncbi:MAG: long-chain fatty acid--CoA ligase [Myxococcales bacterium]|nr:MAG: long-chain fatty acid--CoA ligase [Myxococcales bacterium]
MGKTYQQIEAEMIAPGGIFEVAEEAIRGRHARIYKTRKKSLRELLADSALQGDKDYIVLDDRRIGYAEHLKLVASTAAALRDRYGVSKGDRVAILAENHAEWIITFWATVSLGGIVAALNGWWTADEIGYGLDLVAPKALVADAKRLARAGDAARALPTIEIESDFREILAYAPHAALPDTPIDEDDPALILFTSGTTGRPKGAVQSHRGLLGFVTGAFVHGFTRMTAAAESGASGDIASPSPCMLVTAPLFHISGLHAGAVLMLAAGATTVWRLGRFDPEDVLRIIERERVTNWAGLGAMAPRVLYHPNVEKYDLSSLRNLGAGGAPTSPELQERMRDVAPNGANAVGLGYGSSETCTVVAMIGGSDLVEHPRSVGRIQPCHEVEIRDADGNAVGEGVEGEIFVRSPFNMLEYWRNPEATTATISEDGWLATGDVGRLEEGRLYINARARDLILRGAENVYPVEIEQRLEAHPDVTEAAAAGIDHPQLGQEVKAFVVAAEGKTRDEATLAAWCAETLAPFKLPTKWELRTEPLPRNASGKVLKNVLTGEAENLFVEE